MPNVLMIIAPDQFRDEEYLHPKAVLEARGAHVVTGSIAAGPCLGKLGAHATAEVAIADVDAAAFDAVAFVGGAGSRVFFEDAAALGLARSALANGQVVAAICIAPTVLANAGVLRGRRATAFPDARDALERGGAAYTGTPVEVDGKLITANGPEAARDFGAAIADALALPQPETPAPSTHAEVPMEMFRCRICGETYLGYVKPSNCPFCGAHDGLIGPPEEYSADINEVQLTEVEREDLETSIEIERANTRFYSAMAQRKDNGTLSSAYKRLARIEAEHCSVFCKLAKVPKPADLTEPSGDLGTWIEDIEESMRRENRATTLYATFARRATSPRVREVFAEVSEIEADHILLDELAKRYAAE